jgi:hypothetical protein
MALEVSMTGTGSIGDITPGWSLNEAVTNNVIGSTGSGTGSVSFNAKALDESLLCINNNITSTIEPLGNLSGVVQSVSQSGLMCSIAHGSFLDKFNLDVAVPPVGSGGTKSWFYELCKAIGLTDPTVRPNYSIELYEGTNPLYNFWKTGQVSYCFPFDASPKDLSEAYDIDAIFSDSKRSGSDNAFAFSYTNNDYAGSLASALASAQSTPFLPGMITQSYLNSSGNTRYGTRYFQMMIDVDGSTDVQIWLKIGNTSGSPTYSNMVVFGIQPTDAYVEQVSTSVIDSVSITSLNTSQPLLFTFSVRGNNGVSVHVIDADGVSVQSATTATVSLPQYASGNNLYIAGDYINVSKMYYANFALVKSDDPTNAIGVGTYITPEAIDYGIDIDFTNFSGTFLGAYPSTQGVAWELMQQIASAENFEIATSGETVIVRDIALTQLELDNTAPTPAINPTSTLSGRQINIPYTDAYFVEGVIYDSAADGNNIISVGAGETTVTVVKYDIHPISLLQPLLVNGTEWPTVANQYTVMDSTGLYLNAAEWTDYGAYVSVQIAPDDPSGIEITVKGPYTDVTLAGGPYRIAVSEGQNEFASLKIGGTGVYSGSNVLQLRTGLDPEKYTRATVNTITNPFINTIEQAYDRGVWASNKASGPVVTLSATIPTGDLVAIGSTPGALIDYNQSTYRVLSDTVSNVATSLVSEYYVTVDRVDALWDVGVVNKTFTVNISSGEFTSASHGFVNGTPLQFSTTGALPNYQDIAIVTSIEQVETYTFRYYCENNFYEGQTVAVDGFTGPYASLWNRTGPISAATPTYFDFYSAGDVMYPLPTDLPIAAVGYAKLEGGYVLYTGPNTFNIELTLGSGALNLIGSQSGTHTATTSSFSVADYDDLWGNYECQDQMIFPYKVA